MKFWAGVAFVWCIYCLSRSGHLAYVNCFRFEFSRWSPWQHASALLWRRNESSRCQNVYGCCEKRRMVDSRVWLIVFEWIVTILVEYEMKPSQRIRPSSTQLADQRAQLSRHFCKLFSNRMSKSLIDTSTPRSFYASPASKFETIYLTSQLFDFNQ